MSSGHGHIHHSIHQGSRDQHQPLPRAQHQQTSCHSIHQDHSRSVQGHIRRCGVPVHSRMSSSHGHIHHSIHQGSKDQHQPWPRAQHQQTSCHSIHQDHSRSVQGHIRRCGVPVHNRMSSGHGHIHHSIHQGSRDQHQPWPQAQHQQTSCHNIHQVHSHSVQVHIRMSSGHIHDRIHHSIHQGSRDQHQPWPRARLQHPSCHRHGILQDHSRSVRGHSRRS